MRLDISRALPLLLLAPWNGCTLDASSKIGCRDDRDCNPGRVCNAFSCVASDALADAAPGLNPSDAQPVQAPQSNGDAASIARDSIMDAGPSSDAGSRSSDAVSSTPAPDLDAETNALLPPQADAAPDHDAQGTDASVDSGTCACEKAEANVSWSFPSDAQGFYNVDQEVSVRADAAAVSWLEQLYFVGESGQVASIGFESQGARPDGSMGKVAIFSMSGATGAMGDACIVSSEPDVPTTCRIAYDFLADHSYIWRIWLLNDESSLWWWWGAWIIDAQDPQGQVMIGELRGPPGRMAISYSENHVEYASAAVSCGEPAPSHVHLAPPLLDGVSSRAQPAALGTASVPGCSAATLTQATDGADLTFGAH